MKAWCTNRGITLLEILFATLILAFSLIPISGILGTGTKATMKDYNMIEALQHLEKTANCLSKAPFRDIPLGMNMLTYATPPVFLGNTKGRFGATFTISLDSEAVDLNYQVQPVKVQSMGTAESNPVFDTLTTYNIKGCLKKLTVRVNWSDPGQRGTPLVRKVNLITYVAKLD